MENAEMSKNAEFYCEVCHFICCKKSNYEIHYHTKKHINVEIIKMPYKIIKEYFSLYVQNLVIIPLLF